MNNLPRPLAEQRVLLLAPTAKDAALCRRILGEEGLECVACRDLADVCRELEIGAGAAVLNEDAMTGPDLESLAASLATQPAWSDLPLLVLTRAGADSELALKTLATLGNVTLLERPVRVPTLVSAVRAALRARLRQYQIREHLAESMRTAASLQEEARRKDEFLAMLGHELRNPIAPIRSGIHLLQKSSESGSRAEQVLYMMDRQVSNLVRLVDDLLDVARILRGKIELAAETVDLAEIVRRAVETSEPLLRSQQHSLAVELWPTPLYISADPVRLSQVFANLLNNAAKYTPPGGNVWLKTERVGAEGWVCVRDNGIGIDAEMLPRVFEPFSQAKQSLDRSQGGLGLGLTLVQRLVEMHNGGVQAYSEGLGRGSEFRVRLPLVEPNEPLPNALPGERVMVPASRKILVVDDNRDAANTLTLLLELQGHQVRIAYNGRAALEAASQFLPDVVLLDIGLPEIDGYEVARCLRRRPEFERTVLIAITGYGKEDDRSCARQAGFNHHLVKPIHTQELSRLLTAETPGH